MAEQSKTQVHYIQNKQLQNNFNINPATSATF